MLPINAQTLQWKGHSSLLSDSKSIGVQVPKWPCIWNVTKRI